MGDFEKDGLEDFNNEEREDIEGLFELEEVIVFMEEDGEKIEVKPTLVKDGEGNFTTEETAYEALIGESSGDGITVGINNSSKTPLRGQGGVVSDEVTDSEPAPPKRRQARKTNTDLSVKFTQVGINEVEVKTEDNKALYIDIYPYVDLLLTTLPEGVKEDLILKEPENQL